MSIPTSVEKAVRRRMCYEEATPNGFVNACEMFVKNKDFYLSLRWSSRELLSFIFFMPAETRVSLFYMLCQSTL